MAIRNPKIGEKVIDAYKNIGIINTLPGDDYVPMDSLGIVFDTGYFITMKKYLKKV